MATVYVARKDGRRLALKTIREDFGRSPEFLTMFLDEAKIVSRLVHPCIVRTFEQGTVDGHAFIAMELLEGRSLWAVWDAVRARKVRLRYDVLAWIGARVAEGLHYAHEMRDEHGTPLGIVHRDVNPSNIFVTMDGHVKVIDFGLAKAAGRASRTATGVIKGKVAYMSPEQAVGEAVDRRTDVFALGTTLWEIACDRRLFKGKDDVDTLARVHATKVPDATRLVEGFPPALRDILEGALARERSERIATALELSRRLDAFVAGAVTPDVVAKIMRELFGASLPPPAPDAGVASRSGARRPLVLVGVLVAVVLALGVFLVIALR